MTIYLTRLKSSTVRCEAIAHQTVFRLIAKLRDLRTLLSFPGEGGKEGTWA